MDHFYGIYLFIYLFLIIRTNKWPLVSSPVPIISIFLCYLLIIWVGPKLMAKRQPVYLKPVLIVYNFGMVCLSAYMFYEFTASACKLTSFLTQQMARVCWWFYFSKVIELSDTIFFILRKKNSQLTFLHVYHHATMIFNWWAGVKYVAGGQSFLIGLINSLVHVVMYLYYGLAALGPSMTKYLWWKRHLTSLQLVSFCVFLEYLLCFSLVFNCIFLQCCNSLCFFLMCSFSSFIYFSVILYIYFGGHIKLYRGPPAASCLCLPYWNNHYPTDKQTTHRLLFLPFLPSFSWLQII
uniref:Elongation of very long chain fatty acids protein n=1 Tax=Gouania willdenowi TaxID=441366 RepID=A0A8C5GVH4_GOUWI